LIKRPYAVSFSELSEIFSWWRQVVVLLEDVRGEEHRSGS